MMKSVLGGMVLVASVFMLANCGKSDSGSSSSAPAAVATTGLTTSYGCLQQCGTNMAMYNGQCIQVQVTGGACTVGAIGGTGVGVQTAYGCVQQCGANMGLVNGQCVPVQVTGGACTVTTGIGGQNCINGVCTQIGGGIGTGYPYYNAGYGYGGGGYYGYTGGYRYCGYMPSAYGYVYMCY